MSSANHKLCAFLLATLLGSHLLCLIQTQLLDEDEDIFGTPWPTYSLQNMPKTQFTCRDKILGGYYADPETQCQMFHVCVKLPGVGVQDYRFLCPNSTAFDQELQICANWADVDCDKATSLYDSNNLNDLYRGGEQESKGNKQQQQEEDEGTFHLQRAESGDVRRTKENRGGDQKSRPRHNYAQASSNSNSNLNVDNTQTSKRPITSYYTPTTSSSSSSTTSTSTERSYYNNNNNGNYNNNDDSKQDSDDIFKGSHSSHFFANRHGGREFDEEPASRPRPNDFSDYNRKTTEVASSSKSRATPTRGQRTSSTATSSSPTTTTTAAPATTKSQQLKKITLHASYNTDYKQDYSSYKSSSTTQPSSTLPPPTAAATTPRLGNTITSRFSFGLNDYQTQERIQPTTFNPNGAYQRFKSTELPSSFTKVTGKNSLDYDKETTRRNKPTVAVRKQKLGPQESNYINHNEFADVPKVRLQQPQPFQAKQQHQQAAGGQKVSQLEPQYQRPRASQSGSQISRVGNQEPAPFKASASAPASSASSKSRSFTSRGSITYKATTQRYADDEFFYPTTTSTTTSPLGAKKQSTLAARDSFTPTTFKPTTYKKPYEQSFYQQTQQQTLRPRETQQSVPKKTSPVTPALPTTANPYYNVDEDDGQYHPELYENDFPRNRFKFLRNRSTSSSPSSTTTTTSAPLTSRQPHGFSHNFQQAHTHLKSQQQSSYQKEREQEQSSDVSDDEDELFKTAQSLNFGAASINKLRADIYKAEKTSQQYNSQYSPQVSVSSSPKTTAPTTSSRPTTYSSSGSSSSTYLTSTTTTTSTTTRRPTTAYSSTISTRRPTTTRTTTAATTSKGEQKKSVKNKSKNHKRPPYADEDTSYDYAYYDTD